MCVLSFVGDHYTKKWEPYVQPYNPQVSDSNTYYFNPISRQEFDKLKADVEEMKLLLQEAKQYDADNGEPDCEMQEKVQLLKQVAKLVGVSLEDIFDE